MKVIASKKRKGFLFPGLALMAMGLTVATVQSATYPDMPYTGPTPIPTFPAEFSAFDPPVTNLAPVADAPAIAEWTRSNCPGDTMVLTGHKLSLFTGIAEGRDSHFVVFGQAGIDQYETDAMIQDFEGITVAITLPATNELPANDMYLLWPRNEVATGTPVAVNQTEAW